MSILVLATFFAMLQVGASTTSCGIFDSHMGANFDVTQLTRFSQLSYLFFEAHLFMAGKWASLLTSLKMEIFLVQLRQVFTDFLLTIFVVHQNFWWYFTNQKTDWTKLHLLLQYLPTNRQWYSFRMFNSSSSWYCRGLTSGQTSNGWSQRRLVLRCWKIYNRHEICFARSRGSYQRHSVDLLWRLLQEHQYAKDLQHPTNLQWQSQCNSTRSIGAEPLRLHRRYSISLWLSPRMSLGFKEAVRRKWLLRIWHRQEGR